MKDPSFERFMAGVHRLIEHRDVRAVLREELERRGVNAQVAERRASRLADDFNAFQRVVAEYTFEVRTPREEQLVKEAITLCKRAWLEERIQAEFRSLGV
jgi:hypothetical protein